MVQVAIVRFVPRANGAVVLGACTPYLGSNRQPDCLLLNHLPFFEDVRSFAFASFDSRPEAVPSEDQLSAADALIDSMQLVQGALSKVSTLDGSGSCIGSMQPEAL